ncbi:hypothetical protein PAMA_019273 [Pampus argenteus]
MKRAGRFHSKPEVRFDWLLFAKHLILTVMRAASLDTHVTTTTLWRWKRYTTQSKRDTIELVLKMDMTKQHFERKCHQAALTKWLNWVKLHKKTQAAAIKKLERVVNAARLKRIIAAWENVTKDSKRTKEYFKRLEMGFIEMSGKEYQIGEGCDGLSVLPSSLSVKAMFVLASYLLAVLALFALVFLSKTSPDN